MAEEQGLSAKLDLVVFVNRVLGRTLFAAHPQGSSLPLSFDDLATLLNAARSEGLQPPVGVEEEVFSSLGASKAPSCVSAGVAETPSGGWVLVPPEPTEQMWIAGLQELPFGPSSPDHAMRCYRAMIAAAPPTDRQTSGGEA